ncbi:MAG: ATP-dependent endonuclease [Lacipirellulaceae bacterium]
MSHTVMERANRELDAYRHSESLPSTGTYRKNLQDGRWHPVLVVVEGNHDVAFLSNLSAILNKQDEQTPNLANWEAVGKILFFPTGGGGSGDIAAWGERLARLGQPRFHLHDKECGAEALNRLTVVARIDQHPNCTARITSRRSLENYLHPKAIQRAGGPKLVMKPETNVAVTLAKARLAESAPQLAWRSLSQRSQKRLIESAKRWLNSEAVSQMTPKLLARSDPEHELIGWLQEIRQLVDS